MSTSTEERAMRRILKIRAHATLGAGKERQEARAMLTRMQDQYGFTDADLIAAGDRVSTGWYRFTYATKRSKAMLFQVAASQIRRDIAVIQGRGGFLWMELGPGEHARLLELLVHYETVWDEAEDYLWRAFLHGHGLLLMADGEESLPKLTAKEIDAVAYMVAGIRNAP